MKTYLANPSGYCQGVARAIALAVSFRKANPTKDCFVLGTLVHNEMVTEQLRDLGIHSITDYISNEDKIRSLPNGCALIFSAHGHDHKLDELAKSKNIVMLDATCPIVNESAERIKKAIKAKRQVIFVGTPNHPETVGMLSIDKNVFLYENIKDKLTDVITDKSPYISSQTTLSIYELENTFALIKAAFPKADFQKEICHETKLRQDAIKKLPNDVDAVFIVGGKDSSNTKRLYEMAKKHFTTLKIFHIGSEFDIDPKLLKGCLSCAIISGTSTPLNETMKIKVKLDEIW